MSMYIRLKRKNQTLFLHVEPSDAFLQIKTRIGAMFELEPTAIMLYANDKKRELLDLGTVSDQEIKNDDIVYMIFARESGIGWEELQVDSLEPSSGEEPDAQGP